MSFSEVFSKTRETRQSILIQFIELDPNQPRKHLDERELQKLQKSMKRFGLRQPIGIRKEDDDKLILVFGERRLQAARNLGWTHIDAIVQSNIEDPAERLLVQLVENISRSDLTNLEKGLAGIKFLKERFRTDEAEVNSKLNQALIGTGDPNDAIVINELLDVFGCSLKTFYNNWLALSKLDARLVEHINSRKLEESKALVLGRIKDSVLRQELLHQCLEQGWSLAELRKQIALHLPKKSESISAEQRQTLRAVGNPASIITKLSDEKQEKAWTLLKQLEQLLNEENQ